jgi:hypothetical protein
MLKLVSKLFRSSRLVVMAELIEANFLQFFN